MKGDTFAGAVIGLIIGLFIAYIYVTYISPPATNVIPVGYPPTQATCSACNGVANYRQASYKLDQNSFTGSGTLVMGGATLSIPITNTDNTGAVFQITLSCRRLEGNDTLTSAKIYMDVGSKQTIQINYPSSELGGSVNYNCTVSNVDAPIVNGCT